MKRFLILFIAAISATLFADPKDPVFNEQQLREIHSASPAKPAVSVEKPRKVLLFSKTAGYRHRDGIVGAREALDYMGKKLGIWEIVSSEDVSQFEADNLKQYDAVILCQSTGDFFGKDLSAKYTKNLMDFVSAGGGVFAIHAGVDCYNYDGFRNKAFTDMLGGEFIGHPWGTQNSPVTIVIDDKDSPITKGIWKEGAFRIVDEIYMVGSSYDRSKCRALMRIDVDRSPVTTEWGRNIKIRPDRDIALAWIKNYGKGRVAYGGFCHGWQNYRNPKIQELYMRMLQFVCGDLKADTSSIPFTGKSVYVPMYEKPSKDDIKALSELKYGERDREINALIFAVCANNHDADFCSKLEKFIAAEISAGNGTQLYRELLAELLWATGVKSGASQKRLESSLKDAPDGLKSRVENALAHREAKGIMPLNKSPKMKVSLEMPKDRSELLRTIAFLGANPDVKMPEWLKLDALDENAKAHLIFALARRSENLDEVFKITPQSEEVALALAFAVAKSGQEKGIKPVLDGAEFVSVKMRPVVASYLASAKSDKLVENLFEILKSAQGAKAALIIETVTLFDLDSMVSKLFSGFESMSPEMKLGALKTAESIANKEVFLRAVSLFGGESDKKVKSAILKTLVKCAQAGFDADMFAALKKAYEGAQKQDKPQLLRFAQYDGGADAVEMCKSAYKEGFRDEAVKALGGWKNQSAVAPLLAVAKAASDERAKTLAQMYMVAVGERAGLPADAVIYLLKNSVRADERGKAVDIAVKRPSPKVIEALKSLKMDSEAEKARENLSKIKTQYKSFKNNDMRPMLDGNINSRWSSGEPMKKGNWIAFDFGYPKNIAQIVFKLGSSKNDFPDEIQVFAGASVDSANSKVEAALDYSGNTATVNLQNFDAQVLKIVCAKDKPAFWWSIHEIEIK